MSALWSLLALPIIGTLALIAYYVWNSRRAQRGVVKRACTPISERARSHTTMPEGQALKEMLLKIRAEQASPAVPCEQQLVPPKAELSEPVEAIMGRSVLLPPDDRPGAS